MPSASRSKIAVTMGFRPNKKQKTDPSLRELFKDVVTVKVGIKQETFILHKELVRSKSKFLHAATSASWGEAQTCIIAMPEEDPEVFSIFQNWLYTSELRYKSIIVLPVVGANRTKIQLATEIVLFGERNGAIGFHDEGIDLMLEASDSQLLRLVNVRRIYTKTTTKAPLRLLIQQVAARCLKNEDDAKYFFRYVDLYPRDFVQQVFYEYHKLSRQPKRKMTPLKASAFYLDNSGERDRLKGLDEESEYE